MVKRLLKIIFFAFVLVMPVEGMANYSIVDFGADFGVVETVQISVKGHSVRVTNAQGCIMEVYSVTGAKVMSVKIDSADQTVSLNVNKGCYIVKVGDVARKISVL